MDASFCPAGLCGIAGEIDPIAGAAREPSVTAERRGSKHVPDGAAFTPDVDQVPEVPMSRFLVHLNTPGTVIAVTNSYAPKARADALVANLRRMPAPQSRVGIEAHLDNCSRASKGLPPKPVHGQGGQEMCVTALRTLLGRAGDDELLTTNPAEKLHKGARSETPRRALTLSEIEQLFQEVTTGRDPRR